MEERNAKRFDKKENLKLLIRTSRHNRQRLLQPGLHRQAGRNRRTRGHQGHRHETTQKLDQQSSTLERDHHTQTTTSD